MIKRRKTIADIRNPILRKGVVLVMLALIPVYLPLAVIWLAILEGIPEAWDAVTKIGRTGEADQIKRAWVGSKQSRQNVELSDAKRSD
jgi:hypothetical protein